MPIFAHATYQSAGVLQNVRLIDASVILCRTLAETMALQLICLEAHAKPVQRPAADGNSVWAVLDAWAKEASGAGKLLQLLRTYVVVAPSGIDALDFLFRAACAASMDLLSDVLSGAAPVHEEGGTNRVLRYRVKPQRP